MRLIRELCAERELAAIINIHDVALAQQFADRIVGLRAGEIVFDGLPSELTSEILTTIYGEEDWDTTPEPMDDAVSGDEATNTAPINPPYARVMSSIEAGAAR
tara:strand:- start:15838 stop:16146 length:309 start_codon:yes stop_codon:yes gene_type:complete